MPLCAARTGKLGCWSDYVNAPHRCILRAGHEGDRHYCATCRQPFGSSECAPPFGDVEARDIERYVPHPSQRPWAESPWGSRLCREFGIDPTGLSDAEVDEQVTAAIEGQPDGRERMIGQFNRLMVEMQVDELSDRLQGRTDNP